MRKGRASVSAKKLFEVSENSRRNHSYSKKENHWITLRCGKSIFNMLLGPGRISVSSSLSGREFFLNFPTSFCRRWWKRPSLLPQARNLVTIWMGFYFTIKQAERKFSEDGGSDGHRLSLIDREGEAVRGIEKGSSSRKKGFGDEENIGWSESRGARWDLLDQTHGFLKMGKSLMVIRLIDGEFPEYDQVIRNKMIRSWRG